MSDPRQYVAAEGTRFFRWRGSPHFPEGPRLVRVEELQRYTILVPQVPALSYDGKNWERLP